MDWKLSKKLKAWRIAKAQEEGFGEDRIYMVLKNNAIDELVSKQPTTISGLLNVKGIGAKNGNKYGQELLAIIREHCGVAEPSAPEPAMPDSKSKAGLPWSTIDRSELRNMHEEGQTVKYMAAKLGRSGYAIELKLEELGLASGNKRKYDTQGPATPAKRAAR